MCSMIKNVIERGLESLCWKQDRIDIWLKRMTLWGDKERSLKMEGMGRGIEYESEVSA